MANTNETVTVRLVVAADGALRTLDRFDKEMVAAANASVKASSGVDAFTAHVERMRKAQEAGVPVLKARAAAIMQEERVLQNALGRAEPLYKAQIAAERELSRVVAASSNLVVHGKMRQEDAIRQIMAVEQAHVAQINKVVAAERRAAEAIQGTAMSVRNSADAVQAANVSYSRNSFESSNIAMQFQDIAVSAQMGMSPMMIALQQGTQLSAVFNQMKNPLQALPAAFLSIINPVSLLTIGFVGLAAAAAQWLFQSQESAEETETALERHDKWLDQILVGYQDIQDAAKKAGEEASKLPQSIVELELAIGLKEQQAELDTLNQNIETTRNNIAGTAEFLRELQSIGAAGGEETAPLGALIDQVQFISDIGLSASSTAEELENATLAARELWNMSDDPSIRDMADQVYKLAIQLMGLRARMEETEAAGHALNATDLSEMEHWGDITRDLAGWHDQLDAAARRAAAGIRASYDAAIMAAQGYGEAAGAANVYAGSLQRLQALIPAVAAAQEAQNNLAAAQIEYDKGLDALEQRASQGLNRDVYQEQLDALTAAYDAAREQVSGVAALQEEQERLNTSNSLDALTGREQAVGRITQQYEQQEHAIRDLISTGASQAEVEALLAQNADNLSQALANTNAQFDAQEAKAGGKAAAKLADTYGDILRNGQEFIAQKELEVAALGQSEMATAALRFEQEMLNKAVSKNIELSPTQRAEIRMLAEDMAYAEMQAERINDIYNYGRSLFTSFFEDFRQGIGEGKSLWDSFANAAANALDNIAAKAMEMAAQGLWNMIFGAFMPGFGGGMGGGGPGFLFSANGNVFSSAGLSAYSNQVVSQPTIFPFAKGGTFGVMGEAGPEAIMPLGRDNQGRLGVRTAEPSNGGEIYVRSEITVQNGNLVPIITEVSGQVAGQMVKPVAKAVTRMGQRDRF